MKRLVTALVLAAAIGFPVFAEYPPEGWTDSITEAIKTADAEDKMILLNFTGSDWCSWCERLGDEVLFTPEFESWADDNLVRVFLDFPQAIDQSEETMMQNQVLMHMLGVRGYPTIWLLGSDLTPLLKTGYREGGYEAYISHLQDDQIDVPEADAEKFRDGLRNGIEEFIGPIS